MKIEESYPQPHLDRLLREIALGDGKTFIPFKDKEGELFEVSSLYLTPYQNNDWETPTLTLGSWRPGNSKPIGCLHFWIYESENRARCSVMPPPELPDFILPNKHFATLWSDLIASNQFVGIKIIPDEQEKGIGSLMWSLGLSALKILQLTSCRLSKDGTSPRDPHDNNRSFYVHTTLGTENTPLHTAYNYDLPVGLTDTMKHRILRHMA